MIKKKLQFINFLYSIAFLAIQSTSLEVEKFLDDGLISHQKWPRGIDGLYNIPFVYSMEIRENVHLQHQIQEAMSMLQQNTCIHFENISDKIADGKDYIEFFTGKGCRTMIGRSKGINPLELAEQCEKAPAILNLICLKMGLNTEEMPFEVEKMNQIYPCKKANEMEEERKPKKIVGKKVIGFYGPSNNKNIFNEKLFEAVEEMEEAVEEMEDEAFYLEKLEKEEEKVVHKNEEFVDKFEGGQRQKMGKNEEIGHSNKKHSKIDENEEKLPKRVKHGKDWDWDNASSENKEGNDNKISNFSHEPLILIGFVLYVFLAAAFIGKILVKCCGKASDEMDKPIGGGRRKSSLGRRLRHFSWDASAFGAQQKEREDPREHSQSRPQSPIPTISNGDLRRISVVNFQLPSNGKEYLTVPIYEGLS